MKSDSSINIYESFVKLTSNKQLKTSFFASAIFMLVAHGINYFNFTFANDRIAFFAEPTFTSEASGKWFSQYYQLIHGYSYVPWLIGVLAIIYMTVAVYITAALLRVETILSIFLIAGLYATNVSVITGNLYSGDDFLFALDMSLMSALIWYSKDADDSDSGLIRLLKTKVGLRVILSAIFVSICFGEYGSYASAGVTLVVLSCMVMLIENERVGYIFGRGVEYIASFGIGMALYYGILRLFLKAKNTQMLSYLGEDKLVNGAPISEILGNIILAYKSTINNWRGHYSGNSSYASMPEWMAIAFLALGAIFFVIIIHSNRKLFDRGRIALLTFLLAVFPLAAGLVYVLAFGVAHYLMIFSFVYLYVAIVKMTELVGAIQHDSTPAHRFLLKGLPIVSVILLCAFIFKGVLAANIVYTSMEMKYTYSKGIANRIIDRIETCDGFDGTEDVCLVGHITHDSYFSTPDDAPTFWKNIVGGLGVATERTSFSHVGITPLFLRNIMGLTLQVEVYNENNFSEEEKAIISSMPLYPVEGSVKKIGNRIVVKFAEAE